MPEQKTTPPFLTTPKGVFILGFLLGGLTVLALGFLIIRSGLLNAADLKSAVTAPAPPAPRQNPAPTSVSSIRPVSQDDHVRGAGPVTIVEYSDLECPFCKRFHATMLELMTADKGKVRWVYRHFPLSAIHPHAQKLAEAAECAGDQGKFWEFVDAVFSQPAGADSAKIPAYGKQAGVKDARKLQDCVAAGKYRDKVLADAQDADAAGAQGTPYSIIVNSKGDKQEIPGALSAAEVQPMIDGLYR